MAAVVLVAFLVVAWFAAKAYLRKKRLADLVAKHGDPAVAAKILNSMYWVGQTAEQLRDALGKPLEVDQKVLKTKKREVWKYHRTAKNRYALRITLDNDLVTEWDQRSA